MDYLDQLNEAQRKAVENTEGPTMVLAGAGSGKTRVLTYRIAHLIQLGVDPFQILALTFTNKASREMKARIGNIVGDSDSQNIWMGTFHSIFARILRYEAEKLGYPSNFTIYDTDDSRSLIKTIVKELNLDDKTYKPNLVHNRISSAKNSLINAADYRENTNIQSEDFQSRKPHIGEIYSRYEARCFQAGAMDFDDLLFKTNILLRDFSDVLYKYQDKFRYILVDEFQDTNYSQYLIVKSLAARFENICVVGDDAQSIYAFRGANIRNILDFQQDYPDLKTFKLEQNYRSTKTIVAAANSIIAKNSERLNKDVWTDNAKGEKIKVVKTLTDNEEGISVARSIFETKNNHQLNNGSFAILYRTNAQSRSMEEALRKLNIPYRIFGGLSFYKRKEIKDLLGYFRLTINQNDEEALKRIINYPARGLGKTTLEKIIVAASGNNVSLWNVIESPNQFGLQLNAGTSKKLGDFTTMIKSYVTQLNTHSAFDLGQQIAQSTGILRELYDDKTPEGLSRHENIQALLNGLKEFSENTTSEQPQRYLDEFMQDIALLTDADEADKGKTDYVSLMTIHAAKGLEFPYIHIVGVEENLFPSQLSLNSRADLEEERRLFYVALTRAEVRATLSYATSRYKWGSLVNCEPSRFIEEIDDQHLEMQQGVSRGVPKKANTTQPNPSLFKRKLVKMNSAHQSNSGFTGDDISNLQAGMQVEHQRFGKGKVLKLEGVSPNQKATIFFQGTGQKQLLLKFAKLKIYNS